MLELVWIFLGVSTAVLVPEYLYYETSLFGKLTSDTKTTLEVDRPQLRFCDYSRRRTNNEDDCEPCPQHGICTHGRLVDCDYGYVAYEGKQCLADSTKLVRLQRVESCANELLEDISANSFCNRNTVIWRSWYGDRDRLETVYTLPDLKRMVLETCPWITASDFQAWALSNSSLQYKDDQGLTKFACRRSIAKKVYRTRLLCHLEVRFLTAAMVSRIFLAFVIFRPFQVWSRRWWRARRANAAKEHVVALLQRTPGHLTQQQVKDELKMNDQRIWRRFLELVEKERNIHIFPSIVHGSLAVCWRWIKIS